jgi:hypothetical protein
MGRERRSKFANDAKSTADLASSLAQKANQADLETELITKRTHLYPLVSDTVIPLEIHNQAKQTSGGTTAVVVHNYTDAGSVVVDNVGSGTIMTLSNSQNTTMRPDKPSDFVGSGAVFKYRKFNDTLKDYEEIMLVDAKGNITRSKVDEPFVIACNKANNGFPAINIESTVAQTIPLNIRNGGSFITFQDETSFTKACIVSAAAKTVGMEIRAEAGHLYLKASAASGQVKMFYNNAYYPVQPLISVTTANRPATNLIDGMQIFDQTLGKPLWYKSGTGWVDAMGATV